MDKLLLVAGILFFVADIFAVTSLLNPAWIISRNADFPDNVMLGLLTQCLKVVGKDTVCFKPSLSPEWVLTLLLIVTAIICLTATCILIVVSQRRYKALLYARWIGFLSLVCLCLAAVIFPIGFYIDEIGGRPYRLPKSVSIGSSYIVFFLSILLTVVSELFAEKVCQPLF